MAKPNALINKHRTAHIFPDFHAPSASLAGSHLQLSELILLQRQQLPLLSDEVISRYPSDTLMARAIYRLCGVFSIANCDYWHDFRSEVANEQ
jgi:hypothetical protein